MRLKGCCDFYHISACIKPRILNELCSDKNLFFYGNPSTMKAFYIDLILIALYEFIQKGFGGCL